METSNKKATVWRTIFAVVVSINTALSMMDVTTFGNETVNLIYKVVSMVVNFVVIALNTYFNNDFTPEGAEGTNFTRQLKAMKNENRRGEDGEVNE